MTKVTFISDHPEVWKLYSQFSGKLAFDVGANGGMVSQLLAPNFDQVIAFEPCKESADELRALELPNVILNEVAVSDHNGVVVLEETSVATGGMGELVSGSDSIAIAGFWGEKTGERQVPCITLEKCFDLYGVPDLIKIDTEGHEGHIIVGGLPVLRKFKPKLVIEVHAKTLGDSIFSMLPEYGWEIFRSPIYTQRNNPLAYEHYWVVST